MTRTRRPRCRNARTTPPARPDTDLPEALRWIQVDGPELRDETEGYGPLPRISLLEKGFMCLRRLFIGLEAMQELRCLRHLRPKCERSSPRRRDGWRGGYDIDLLTSALRSLGVSWGIARADKVRV